MFEKHLWKSDILSKDAGFRVRSPLIYFFYLHTIIRPTYMSFIYSFFSARPFDLKLGSSLIYFFICTRPFDQKLGSLLIYFFYLHTTIRPNYMILFHYSFFNARPFDQKLGSTLIYVFHLYTTV